MTISNKKKPLTSYILFCIENRPILKDEFPHKKPKDITKELAKRWRNLDIFTKDLYRQKSSEIKNGTLYETSFYETSLYETSYTSDNIITFIFTIFIKLLLCH